MSDSLASIHEWSHHELNNVSSYGLLLSYYAFLARNADEHQDAFEERLRQLVSTCKVAHEVYATWYSVELLRSKFKLDQLIGTLPSDYLAFLKNGERIVTGVDSPFLRQQAFLVSIRSCFEAAPFAEFDCSKSTSFQISQVREKHLPNARLEFLLQHPVGELFQEWATAYCESAPSDDSQAVGRAIERGREQDFFDGSLNEADAVLRRFLCSLTLRMNQWLLDQGRENGQFEAHLTLVHSLVDDMNQRCSNAVATHPLAATTSPHDTAAVLLQQMESEIVRIRANPLPAVVRRLGDLPRDIWSRLPVGQPPHLFIQGRFAQRPTTTARDSNR